MILKTNQRAVYHVLNQVGGCYSEDIGELTGRSKDNAYLILRQLVGFGLAKREKSGKSYIYTAIASDVEYADFAKWNVRTSETRSDRIEDARRGIQRIGNMIKHSIDDDRRTGSYSGQRPSANHGGFASSEMV
ncbi:MAG: hypothetical protein ACYC4K_08260 [Thiobacillus sp.]